MSRAMTEFEPTASISTPSGRSLFKDRVWNQAIAIVTKMLIHPAQMSITSNAIVGVDWLFIVGSAQVSSDLDEGDPVVMAGEQEPLTPWATSTIPIASMAVVPLVAMLLTILKSLFGVPDGTGASDS